MARPVAAERSNAPRTPRVRFLNETRPIFALDEQGRRNRALQTVPSAEWQRFAALLQGSVIVPGRVLYQEDALVDRVYFPHSGVVSLIGVDRCRQVEHTLEVATVGQEGVIGVQEALSGERSTYRVQGAVMGTAWCMEAAALRQEFRRGGALANWLLRYFSYLAMMASQGMLCSHYHTLEERLANWVLSLDERLDGAQIEMTHETIGQLLGNRRSGITMTLGALQQAGFIKLTRGAIGVQDRDGLEGVACECYLLQRARREALRQ